MNDDPCEPREPTARELALGRALVRAQVKAALLQTACAAEVQRAGARMRALHYCWLRIMVDHEQKWNARHLELTAELRARVQELETQVKEKRSA